MLQPSSAARVQPPLLPMAMRDDSGWFPLCCFAASSATSSCPGRAPKVPSDFADPSDFVPTAACSVSVAVQPFPGHPRVRGDHTHQGRSPGDPTHHLCFTTKLVLIFLPSVFVFQPVARSWGTHLSPTTALFLSKAFRGLCRKLFLKKNSATYQPDHNYPQSQTSEDCALPNSSTT